MAGKKGRAPAVRTLLAAIKGRLSRKGATSERIVAILKKDHPKAIETETADILHIGLIKLASSAGTNAPKAKAQLEMFAEYDLPKMVVLRQLDSKGHVQRIHKAVGALTIAEAKQYVEDHSAKPRSRLAEHVKELARLLDDVGHLGKSDVATLDELWAQSQAASV